MQVTKAILVVFLIGVFSSPVSAKEWLTGKQIQDIIAPAGKFRDKGKGWCQYYGRDGTFTFKNLKTGETRLGKYWVDNKDRACIRGPKMSKDDCGRGYLYQNGSKLFYNSSFGNSRINVSRVLASHNACKFKP